MEIEIIKLNKLLIKIIFITDEDHILSFQSSATLHPQKRLYMEQLISSNAIQHVFTPSYTDGVMKPNIIKRFTQWCGKQEDNRFLWLGISFFGHIGMILPLTLLSIIFFANNNFTLWIIVCSVNVPVLALNLAAQPPKVTLPVMFVSFLLDIVMIGACAAVFLIK